MVGKYDFDRNRLKYHGQRRNATAGINYNKNNFNDADSEANSDPSYPTSSREANRRDREIYRPKERRGVQKFSNTHHGKYKSNDLRKLKNFDDKLINNEQDMRPRNFDSRNKFKKNLESVSRQKPTRNLQIGDENNNESKPFLNSISNCKLSYMDSSIFDLIVKFMQQYFMCYDKNRDELIAAYNPKALYSISLNVSSDAAVKSSKFGSYFKESRNLLHVIDTTREFRLLLRSNIEIVASIKKMPLTEHIADSLKLDCTFLKPNLLSFSMVGVFREGKQEDKYRPFRSFQRVFVCIPLSNNRMSIINEQIIISNLSEKQALVYNIEKFDQKIKDELETNVNKNSLEKNEQIKQNLILEFSKRTNLNLKWSKDCLEFSGYNLELAEKNFNEYKNEIPSDAFNV